MARPSGKTSTSFAVMSVSTAVEDMNTLSLTCPVTSRAPRERSGIAEDIAVRRRVAGHSVPTPLLLHALDICHPSPGDLTLRGVRLMVGPRGSLFLGKET